MNNFPYSGKLLNARSALAIFPQIPGRIGTYMSIVPGDFSLFRIQAFDPDRR
jgi:hypothetical protein